MDYDVIDVKYIHLTEILDSKKRSRLTARLYSGALQSMLRTT